MELVGKKGAGADAFAVLGEFTTGVLEGTAGITDFFAAPIYSTLSLIYEGENWLETYVDYYGSEGATAAVKEGIRVDLEEYERLNTHFRDINGDMTGVGKYVAGISSSIGQMVPAMLIAAGTGG